MTGQSEPRAECKTRATVEYYYCSFVAFLDEQRTDIPNHYDAIIADRYESTVLLVELHIVDCVTQLALCGERRAVRIRLKLLVAVGANANRLFEAHWRKSGRLSAAIGANRGAARRNNMNSL